ncbi:hypothetical protein [Neisseria weaveri]|uniref:hypothetical protein n=1 Tax=Neisseria weaveri TaxID=28091 RepID=UPI00131B64E3|nr:hypothetical protein [Neisseria weaveri]
MSYHIGQHFKQNDELNKLDGGKRPGEGSKEHIALHTLNGLLTGAANGSHAVVSGLSAGGRNYWHRHWHKACTVSLPKS